MVCKNCHKYYEPWHDGEPIENHLCSECNMKAWEEFEEDHAEDYKNIGRLQAEGHPHHCACRQVWGDGECECDFYKKGYDPYGWMKG